MNTSSSDFDYRGELSGFDSRDSIILIIDGPGDNTIRPSRPELRQRALEFQKLLARYSKAQGQSESPAQPPPGTSAEDAE
jgi:hypothetical protein